MEPPKLPTKAKLKKAGLPDFSPSEMKVILALTGVMSMYEIQRAAGVCREWAVDHLQNTTPAYIRSTYTWETGRYNTYRHYTYFLTEHGENTKAALQNLMNIVPPLTTK